jgi:hypothetical protein
LLTLEKLKEIKKHSIFATGTAIDNELGLFMTGSGRELRWVAVTGEINDWCIYCHFAEHDIEWIKRQGDKVCMERNIKMCVPCDDEAFKKYRY